MPIHQITVVGYAVANNTALVTDVGIQVECTISEYISKERQVELPIILFHPTEARFTNQTTTIKLGSTIFFSGALTLIEDKLYLELQNFSFFRAQASPTKQLPWLSKKTTTSTSPSPSPTTNIAKRIHYLNKNSTTSITPTPILTSTTSTLTTIKTTPISTSPNVETTPTPISTSLNVETTPTPVSTSLNVETTPTPVSTLPIFETTPTPVSTSPVAEKQEKTRKLPTPTSSKRKTRSSHGKKKAQKLADIASNMISVVDSDHEESEN